MIATDRTPRWLALAAILLSGWVGLLTTARAGDDTSLVDRGGREAPRRTWRTRLLLYCDLVVMSLAFWLLLSLALNPARTIVHDVEGASYAGPLTWPARWLGLNSLSRGGVTTVYIALMIVLCLAYVIVLYLVRSDRRRSTTGIASS